METPEEAVGSLAERGYTAFLTERFGGSLHISKRRVEVQPGSGLRGFSPTAISLHRHDGRLVVVPRLCPGPDVPFEGLSDVVAHAIELLEDGDPA